MYGNINNEIVRRKNVSHLLQTYLIKIVTHLIAFSFVI